MVLPLLSPPSPPPKKLTTDVLGWSARRQGGGVQDGATVSVAVGVDVEGVAGGDGGPGGRGASAVIGGKTTPTGAMRLVKQDVVVADGRGVVGGTGGEAEAGEVAFGSTGSPPAVVAAAAAAAASPPAPTASPPPPPAATPPPPLAAPDAAPLPAATRNTTLPSDPMNHVLCPTPSLSAVPTSSRSLAIATTTFSGVSAAVAAGGRGGLGASSGVVTTTVPGAVTTPPDRRASRYAAKAMPL